MSGEAKMQRRMQIDDGNTAKFNRLLLFNYYQSWTTRQVTQPTKHKIFPLLFANTKLFNHLWPFMDLFTDRLQFDQRKIQFNSNSILLHMSGAQSAMPFLS